MKIEYANISSPVFPGDGPSHAPSPPLGLSLVYPGDLMKFTGER